MTPTSEQQQDLSTTGVILACISSSMMFAALTSALLVRGVWSDDWNGFPLPWILWLNTAVLAASSYFLERGHRVWSLVLGLAFLSGQTIAWGQLSLSSRMGEAFFFTFTGLHAAHVLVGIWALAKARLQPARIFWHFLSGMWIVIMLFLAFWGRR